MSHLWRNKIDNRLFSFGFLGRVEMESPRLQLSLRIVDLRSLRICGFGNARAAIAHRPIYRGRKKFRTARDDRRAPVELDLSAFASARLVLNPRQTCELSFCHLAPMSARQPA